MEYHYDHAIDLDNPDDLYTKVITLTGRNKTVLDVGCGSGQIGAVLTDRFACRVAGLEIDAGGCEIARNTLWKVVNGNAEELELASVFQPSSFDVVLCLDVLEHMINPWLFIQRVKVLLKSNGYLIATIPNMTHASVVLELLAGKFRYRDLGLLDKNHVRFFTLDSVRNLFQETGYRIELLDRNIVDVKYLELDPGAYQLPQEVVSFVKGQPESNTYQFILKTRPL